MNKYLDANTLQSMLDTKSCKGIQCSSKCPAYDINNDCNVMYPDSILTVTAIKRITKVLNGTFTAEKDGVYEVKS